MLVVGFDIESTGLDLQRDDIIEFAAVLWDTDAKTKKAKQKITWMISGEHPEDHDGAFETHGITPEDLHSHGIPFELAIGEFHEMCSRAIAIVAHNGNEFDKPMYENNCTRRGITPIQKLWIDTKVDIAYPSKIVTRKLSYLATEHEFINPFPHDAMSDVLTMLRIANKYDWDTTIELARCPTLYAKAEVDFHRRDLAKRLGFSWYADKKIWCKPVKELLAEELSKACSKAGFNVTFIGEVP